MTQPSRPHSAGALPLKCRVSTSTRSIAPGAPRRTTVQSCPGSRRRLVSHPSPMFRASPGMIRLCRDPKNMSLHPTTTETATLTAPYPCCIVKSGEAFTLADISDGGVLGTFNAGTGPTGVAFDGTNIWVTNIISNNVTEFQASNGSVLGTFNAGLGPMGVAFDGTNIWIADMSGNNVTRLRASDGAPMGTFSAGSAPEGIAFDGVFIWVTNHSGSSASKL